MKIVINKCYGGFGLSDKAIDRLEELGYEAPEGCRTIERDRVPEEYGYEFEKYWGLSDIPRDHPLLVQVVEELGSKADRRFAELKVVEIPEGVDWVVEEYDGTEWIREVSRTWE
jgi:hypothetical protein